MRPLLPPPRVFVGAVFLALACIAIAGCGGRHATMTAPPSITPSAAAPAPQGPVIVTLRGQHYSIVISAGHGSPVYTVQTASGELLASNLTLDEIRRTNFDLYQQLAPMLSPGRSAASAVVWAGM